MAWQQLLIEPGPPGTDAIEAALFESGALSVTLLDAEDQPILEPEPGTTPLWPRVRLVGLFDDTVDLNAVVTAMEDRLGSGLPPSRIEVLPQEDWERAWLRDFKPMRFGDRLWICPGGQSPDRQDAVVVELDPGLAFGTGTHPTTALCLEWLDRNLAGGTHVLDYGCGSGVLSVAALKLGAQHVTAVDIDPQALQATRNNANRNEIGDRVCCCPPDQLGTQRFDLIVANILAGTLIDLFDTIAPRSEAGATLVMSGILEAQAEQVLACYGQAFDMDDPVLNDDWALLSGRRRPV